MSEHCPDCRHYKRRSEQLEMELNEKYDIIKACGEWYHAWQDRSISRMREANLKLREAISHYLREPLTKQKNPGEQS